MGTHMSERYNLHDKSRAAPGGGTLRSNRPLLALRAARPDCFRSPAGQNAPQDRFVSPASSPVRLNQTQRHPTGASVFGAGGGTLRSNRPLLALRAARPDCFRSPAGQNAPQDRFVSPASSPVRLNQTQRHPTGASVFGAGGGTLRSNRPLLALRAARPDCFRSPAGQNAPQDRFVSPASSPVRLNQTQRHPTGASVFGAGGGTRTHTVLLPTDFESVTSANSITPANMFKFCTYISLTHFLNGFKRENHIILKI